MKYIICENYEEMSKVAAGLVIQQLERKKDSVLGLATGSTPEGLYKELVAAYQRGRISFEEVRTVNLDEYIGIDVENPQSYHYYMNKHLFQHVNLAEDHIFVPLADPGMGQGQAEEYNDILDRVGRRDIQILGIGHNGHVAFLEPHNNLFLRTTDVQLSEDTIRENSRFFDRPEEVPTRAITMGIQDIMNAEHIILLANGESKREAIGRLMASKELDTKFPVSCLYLHPKVTVIVDKIAAGQV